jgi:hypothetical protein
VGIAAYADFKTALDFVRALRTAVEEASTAAGVAAAGAAAATGVGLLVTAIGEYLHWYAEAHTTYELCREVGGYRVCFTIKRPAVPLDSEHLVVIVSGGELFSRPLYRALAITYLPTGDSGAASSNVRMRCTNVCTVAIGQTAFSGYVECVVEVEKRESSERVRGQPLGSCLLIRCRYEDVKVYTYSWRVRVDFLGIKEAQAPSRTLKNSYTVERGCWIEYDYSCWYGRCSDTPSGGSSSSGSSSSPPSTASSGRQSTNSTVNPRLRYISDTGL